ncbi:MAG: hypothetical protein KDB01_05770 [Planctomycetaceae bacterium]|nr:hypothetical protein [Planctomycetaceae bacterium]
MPEIPGILVTVAVITIAYFFGPPILIYRTQRFRRNMNLLEFDPETIPTSRIIEVYFDDAIEEMEKIGFECLGEYALPDVVPNACAVVQLHRNVRTRESAMVSTVWGVADGIVQQRIQYVEFVCRFQNDKLRMIQTSSISRCSSFPDRRDEVNSRLPHVKSTIDLYHYHERLMQRHDPGTKRELRVDDEFHGDAMEFLRQVVLVECFDAQIETGYLQPCDVGWRPTIYGAIMMTWKELWPMKAVLTARLHARGRRLAVDLDNEFGPLPKW